MSVVALDIGTSHTKALLARWDGRIVAVSSARTPTQSAAPGQLDFPADAVYGRAASLVAALARAHPGDPVDTLVFSCLGTAMVPVDRDGRPLGPALSPADVRPSTTPGVLDGVHVGADALVEITGQHPRIVSFIHHWLWWRQVHPEVIKNLHRLRSLRGYIVHGLCGADAEDQSWASRTMLMDLATSCWSETVLAAIELPRAVLPEIHPSTAVWSVARAAGERFGLSADARVVLGGMDNCCAVLGATDPGERRLVNIAGTYDHLAGTGGLDVARATAAAVDGHVHSYVLPNRFLSLSRVPLGHLMARVAEESADSLDHLLDRVADRAAGLDIALDEGAVRTALRAGTPPGVVMQALQESAAAVLARAADAWDEAGVPADRIVVVGGGARRANLLQLRANLLHRPLSRLVNDESPGHGALRLAAMAVLGATPSDACMLFPNPVVGTWSPDASARSGRPARIGAVAPG